MHTQGGQNNNTALFGGIYVQNSQKKLIDTPYSEKQHRSSVQMMCQERGARPPKAKTHKYVISSALVEVMYLYVKYTHSYKVQTEL